MQNHQASEIGPRCVVYCFHDRLLFWNGLLFRSQEECTVFSFERLRCWEASPLTRWVNHTRIPWVIGEDQTQCSVYPFFLADKSVEMVEFVCWVVLCLDGEASLGFDDIGHTF